MRLDFPLSDHFLHDIDVGLLGKVLVMVDGAQVLATAVPFVLVEHIVVMIVESCGGKVVMLSENDVEMLLEVEVANCVSVGIVIHD